MLEIIVSSPMPFAGIDVDKYQDLLDNAIEDGHTPISIEYLHGELERVMGYDIGVCLNGEEFMNKEESISIPGIYEAHVIGYPRPCKAFIWHSNGRELCLIVDITSPNDVEYAQKCYTNEVFSL